MPVVQESKVVPLPTTLVYESQLHELAAELTNYVNLESRHLTNQISKLSDVTTIGEQNLKSLLKESLQDLESTLRGWGEASLESIEESLKRLREEDELSRKESVQRYDELTEKLQNSEHNSVKLYNKAEERLRSSVDKLQSETEILQREAYKAITDVESTLKSILEKRLSEVNGRLSDFIDSTKTKISDIEDDVQTLDAHWVAKNSDLKDLIDKLESNIKGQIGSVDRELEELVERVGDLEPRIDEIVEALNKNNSKKPKNGKDGKDGKDGIDGEDGAQGKDGKDAYQWEFKPHPTLKGFLAFKREDEDQWKKIDLRVFQPNPQSNFVAGGGLVASGGFGSISLLEDGVQQTGELRSLNFTGNLVETTTDVDGNATISINMDASGNVFKIFTKQLSGTSTQILASEYDMENYYSYRVYNSSTGRDVSIEIETDGTTFNVYALVPMDELVFEIRGY